MWGGGRAGPEAGPVAGEAQAIGGARIYRRPCVGGWLEGAGLGGGRRPWQGCGAEEDGRADQGGEAQGDGNIRLRKTMWRADAGLIEGERASTWGGCVAPWPGEGGAMAGGVGGRWCGDAVGAVVEHGESERGVGG